MIRINTDELDRLSSVFIQLGSDVDNALGRTKMLRSEMLADAEFMSHPKSEWIISTMDWTVDSLISIGEDIRSVESLFVSAKNEFSGNEKELVKAIEEINKKLDSIRIQLDATMNSNQVVAIDRSETIRPVNEMEKLVAGSVADLEMANIAALSEMARKETGVKEITDRK